MIPAIGRIAPWAPEAAGGTGILERDGAVTRV